jgi:hypothetical protein
MSGRDRMNVHEIFTTILLFSTFLLPGIIDLVDQNLVLGEILKYQSGFVITNKEDVSTVPWLSWLARGANIKDVNAKVEGSTPSGTIIFFNFAPNMLHPFLSSH